MALESSKDAKESDEQAAWDQNHENVIHVDRSGCERR
jgi:hypothetical protein